LFPFLFLCLVITSLPPLKDGHNTTLLGHSFFISSSSDFTRVLWCSFRTPSFTETSFSPDPRIVDDAGPDHEAPSLPFSPIFTFSVLGLLLETRLALPRHGLLFNYFLLLYVLSTLIPLFFPILCPFGIYVRGRRKILANSSTLFFAETVSPSDAFPPSTFH